MASQTTTPLTGASLASQRIAERLLLAKELYLHGVRHSEDPSPLSKMLAVHHFHNSVEVVLRSIVSHFGIQMKQREPSFYDLLDAIGAYLKTQLTRRGDLESLNKVRNQIQHDAVEPAPSTMQQSQVTSELFLRDSCLTYFALDFDTLSPITLVADEALRKILELSQSSLSQGDFVKSVTLAKGAFFLADAGIWDLIPNQGSLSSAGDFDIRQLLDGVNENSKKAQYYATLLWSGVNPVDYKRFESAPPNLDFGQHGDPLTTWGTDKPDQQTAQWLLRFVTDTIVRWQAVGLNPSISDWGTEAAKKLMTWEYKLP